MRCPCVTPHVLAGTVGIPLEAFAPYLDELLEEGLVRRCPEHLEGIQATDDAIEWLRRRRR